MSDKQKVGGDTSAAAGTAPALNKAPPDRRQNGFGTGGASGESAGSSRGKQGNG